MQVPPPSPGFAGDSGLASRMENHSVELDNALPATETPLTEPPPARAITHDAGATQPLNQNLPQKPGGENARLLPPAEHGKGVQRDPGNMSRCLQVRQQRAGNPCE